MSQSCLPDLQVMVTLHTLWTNQLRRFDAIMFTNDFVLLLSLVTVCTVYFLVSNRCDLGSIYSTLAIEACELQLRALIPNLIMSSETS